jgi:2'-5' RNA ligase
VRLFVSVDLHDLGDAVSSVQDALQPIPGIRCTDPENTHVTLKFLGEVETERLDTVTTAVERGVERSGVEPFDLHLAGLGAFPSQEYITVVWAGVDEGATPLRQLHETVEAELTAPGFEPEEHSFTPHATIARMDHAAGKDRVQDLLRTRDPELGIQHVETVALTESTLTESGPVYETLDRFPLGT